MSTDHTIVYVAKAGDYLVKIAREHGTTWQAIWNHRLNADHRRKRGSPDVLGVGDVLHVPSPAAAPPAQPPEPPKLPSQPPAPPSPQWPYGPLPEHLSTSEPRWRCPGGLCECDEHREVDRHSHWVFLHDHQNRRMPGARCRIFLNGVQINDDPYGDSAGGVEVDIPAGVQTLVVEWAPAHTPLEPPYPYRKVYHVELTNELDEGVRRRLHNIGFGRSASLKTNVEAFQREYGHPIDGEPASAYPIVLEYHDEVRLPPCRYAADRADAATASAGPMLLPGESRGSQGAVSAADFIPVPGALTISSSSHRNAPFLVALIKAEPRLPEWFREALNAMGDHLIVAQLLRPPPRRTFLSGKQVECLVAVIDAIQSDKWHLSTGALLTKFSGRSYMNTGLEPNDPLVHYTHQVTPVAHPPQLKGGTSIAMASTDIEQPQFEGDYHVSPATAKGTAANALREPTRSLVWLQSRAEEEAWTGGTIVGVDVTPRELVDAFLHELAAHADLINQGRLSESKHGPPETEADQRAGAIRKLIKPDASVTANVLAALVRAARQSRPQPVSP